MTGEHTNKPDHRTEDLVGPRTAYARRAFAGHFDRAPTSDPADVHWIAGYVAALEDLPNEALASLGIS